MKKLLASLLLSVSTASWSLTIVNDTAGYAPVRIGHKVVMWIEKDNKFYLNNFDCKLQLVKQSKPLNTYQDFNDNDTQEFVAKKYMKPKGDLIKLLEYACKNYPEMSEADMVLPSVEVRPSNSMI